MARSSATPTKVSTNGITLHVIEHGCGPAVLLCHGFPETARSWHHQIEALAQAGHRVIAPDMRGYGGSSAPQDAADYTQLHIVGDLVGLLDTMGIEQAAIVGHDWGAITAWNAALMRPDRFPRVAGLSVPYVPRGETNFLQSLRANNTSFYVLHFQRPEADAAMAADVPATLHRLYHAASGNASGATRWNPFAAVDALLPAPPTELPPWLARPDFDHAVASFSQTGFHGALNWYRAMDLTFDLMAPFKDAKIVQPSLFIAGARDPALGFLASAVARLPKLMPGLVDSVMIEQAGHWVQQEAPAHVNQALIAFLAPAL